MRFDSKTKDQIIQKEKSSMSLEILHFLVKRRVDVDCRNKTFLKGNILLKLSSETHRTSCLSYIYVKRHSQRHPHNTAVP